jgi:hypothetical protein
MKTAQSVLCLNYRQDDRDSISGKAKDFSSSLCVLTSPEIFLMQLFYIVKHCCKTYYIIMIIWCFMSRFRELQTLTYRYLLELPYKVLSSYARSIIFRALILQTGIWATSAAWDDNDLPATGLEV